MRRMLAGAVALACLAVPGTALADWEATRWGMSAAQVVATVPGARAVQGEPGDRVWKHDLGAIGPHRDGDLDLAANFYFDGEGGLAFVKTMPTDFERCGAYRALLEGRYGSGEVRQENLGVVMIAVGWTDPATRERLLFSSVQHAEGAPPSRCHFIVQRPA
jgi:hypothetical protein